MAVHSPASRQLLFNSLKIYIFVGGMTCVTSRAQFLHNISLPSIHTLTFVKWIVKKKKKNKYKKPSHAADDERGCKLGIISTINSFRLIILVCRHPAALALTLLFQMLLSHPLFARDPQLQQQIRQQIPGFLQQVGWLTLNIKDVILLWWRRRSIMWIINEVLFSTSLSPGRELGRSLFFLRVCY